ncbi:unnamed protein product [Meganyctiphanes norvegica]|uniref:Uncharacterized protein n=1 Tax=Meganyctiphanes norvegica TaxID=48144 RepID=A0AAV2RUT8_MEGNR
MNTTSLLCLVILAVALGEAFPLAQEGYDYAPPPPAPYAPAYEHIPILQDDRSSKGSGYDAEYSFTYKTGNGITRSESGAQQDGQVSSGGWSYTAPEGTPIALEFVADHGGYQPQGAHLPVAPPLEYERTQEFSH